VSPTVAELLKQQTESTAGTPNVNGISTPGAVKLWVQALIGSKDYRIGICCFSTKHETTRRNSKDWSQL
jgi:hypothetical protein